MVGQYETDKNVYWSEHVIEINGYSNTDFHIMSISISQISMFSTVCP